MCRGRYTSGVTVVTVEAGPIEKDDATKPLTRRTMEMDRFLTKMALGFPIPLAAMLPRVVTAGGPVRNAVHSPKPTREWRPTVTVAGYFRLTVPRGT